MNPLYDALVYVGRGAAEYRHADLPVLRAMFAKYGVARALALSFAGRELDMARGNDLLFEALVLESRLIPCPAVSPDACLKAGNEKQLIDGLIRKGARGVCLFPKTCRISLDRRVVGRLLRAIEERRLLLALFETSLPDAVTLANEYPDIPILIHQPAYQERMLLPALKQARHLHISMAPYFSPFWVLEILAGQGLADQIVFASGFPDSEPGAAIGYLAHSTLSEEDAGKIASGNLRRLLGNVRVVSAAARSYIRTVTRGEGWAPGQKRESASSKERAFRERMEERKTRLLDGRMAVEHPVTLTEEQVERARRNIKQVAWAAAWFEEQKAIADFLLGQSAGYVERMIPKLTPTGIFGFSCPRCVGKKSGEGFGAFRWDYRTPEVIHCGVCGQVLPDSAFPETGVLVCPRRGQTFTYYRSEAERAHPDDRTGRYAWQWVWKPMAVSFTGIVRERKIRFMFHAVLAAAQVCRLTGDARYAELAVRILQTLALRFPNWLYHDQYGAVADCDPLYAAAHDTSLKLDFKRHPYEMAYGGSTYETGPVDDTPEKARMLATLFGAGRLGFPDTSGMALYLGAACRAYDLIHDAKGTDGRPLWTDEGRRDVERNLILEYALETEPWLGGPGQAQNVCNKAPEVYHGLAAVGVCLGLPEYAHVALMGFENIRDQRFLHDGISRECALYMDKYLSDLLEVTELLHGFRWPERFKDRAGVVDVYGSDPKFRRMMQAVVEELRSDGTWFPLSDTFSGYSNRKHVFEICLRRCPDFPSGLLPLVYENGADWYSGVSYKGLLPARSENSRNRGGPPTHYALFNLEAESFQRCASPNLPEIYFPAWMTAILRHGQDPDATDLAIAFNPPGTHQHSDNLSLYYSTRARAVLGDLGYMADTPFLIWYISSFSHNLVVVDDKDQLNLSRNGEEPRRPALRWMVTSPRVSAVEAESRVYPQCSDYRRTVVLLKGPGADTFVVDIFRVKGGRKHAYRLFSELAANDVKDSGLDFVGLSMPPDQPLPNYGGSVLPEHVYGLIEKRRTGKSPPYWQAVWKESSIRYRLHMFTPAAAVVELHGPGQELRELASQIGRRVRYLDVIRAGENLTSDFVAIHEPSGADGTLPILKAERLNVPASAGTNAVALRMESKWGTYLVLSDFEQATDIAGVRFQGALGICCWKPEAKGWCFSLGAGTMSNGNAGVAGETAWWKSQAVSNTESRIIAASKRPADWSKEAPGVQNHVLVEDGQYWTGFPVQETGENVIKVQRFPLQKVNRFRLPAVRTWEIPPCQTTSPDKDRSLR